MNGEMDQSGADGVGRDDGGAVCVDADVTRMKKDLAVLADGYPGWELALTARRYGTSEYFVLEADDEEDQ